MTEELRMTGEMRITEEECKDFLIHGGWATTPKMELNNDYPDICKDCLHRGTTFGMKFGYPFCQYYHVVLHKDTLDHECKYFSTKVGE